MEFTMQSGGLPVGSYRAEFIGCEPYNDNAEKYGQGVALKWRVLEGEHAGSEATRICSAKMTAKTALGRFAAAIAGRAIQPGERFSFASYFGVKGSLLVEQVGEGSRVSTFLRQPEATAQQPQVTPQPTQPQQPVQPQVLQQTQQVPAQPQQGQQAPQQQQASVQWEQTQQQASEKF